MKKKEIPAKLFKGDRRWLAKYSYYQILVFKIVCSFHRIFSMILKLPNSILKTVIFQEWENFDLFLKKTVFENCERSFPFHRKFCEIETTP